MVILPFSVYELCSWEVILKQATTQNNLYTVRYSYMLNGRVKNCTAPDTIQIFKKLIFMTYNVNHWNDGHYKNP